MGWSGILICLWSYPEGLLSVWPSSEVFAYCFCQYISWPFAEWWQAEWIYKNLPLAKVAELFLLTHSVELSPLDLLRLLFRSGWWDAIKQHSCILCSAGLQILLADTHSLQVSCKTCSKLAQTWSVQIQATLSICTWQHFIHGQLSLCPAMRCQVLLVLLPSACWVLAAGRWTDGRRLYCKKEGRWNICV